MTGEEDGESATLTPMDVAQMSGYIHGKVINNPGITTAELVEARPRTREEYELALQEHEQRGLVRRGEDGGWVWNE